MALSEPEELVRTFEQGDRAVRAALASGVAAVLPAATPANVDITGVSFDGRLLYSAAGAKASIGSASVRVSFEATMPATSAFAVNFSAPEFSQAAAALESSLALQLASGALNFTVLGVAGLEVTLVLVGLGPTPPPSPAKHALGDSADLLALSMAVCVAVCCVGAFTWRQAGSCRRESCKGKRRIVDHDAVPAVKSDPRAAQMSPLGGVVPLDEDGDRSPSQLAPGEAEGDEPVACRTSCVMASPGMRHVPAQPGGAWQFRLGGLATIEGVWEMPCVSGERRQTEENSVSLLEVTYEYR